MRFKMIHENFNVADLDVSMAFYEKALGLREARRKTAEDGSHILVYLKNDESDFELELTWLALNRNFLCQHEDTRVTALRDLVLKCQFEILKFVSEDNVTTTRSLTFACTCTIELQATILDSPASWNLILTITTPAV